MTGNLYELSDQLFQLRRDFLRHEVGGVFLTEERVRQLTAGLLAMGQVTLRFAHEVAGHRRVADVGDVDDQVVAEAMRPGTNLLLLSVAGRPPTRGFSGDPA